MSHKLSDQFEQIYDWLTDPIRIEYPVGEMRKAKLTSMLLFLTTVLVSWETINYGNTPAITPFILAATYVLSRIKNYKIAAIIMLGVLCVPSLLVIQEANPGAADAQPVQWLLMPIVLASFLFSLRSLILVVLSIALALTAMVLHNPAISSALIEPTSFLLAISLLIIVVAYQRNMVEVEREEELRQSIRLLQNEIQMRQQIEQTLQRKMDQLDELRRLTLEMTAELDTDILMSMIVSNGLALLGGDLGGLFLYSVEEDVFILSATNGSDGSAFANNVIPRGHGIVGRVWDLGAPMVVKNYRTWDGRMPNVVETMTQKSFIAVPLKWQHETPGVLVLATDQENYYVEDDARIINFLGTQAAVALQNAQLNARILENTNNLQKQIDEREKAERALRDSQEMLRAIIDSIPIRVFWKDLDLNYLGCNQPFAQDAGFSSPDDIIGKSDFDLAWKLEEATFFREMDRQVIEANQPEYNIVEPQQQADGRQMWLNTNKVPLKKYDGEVFGILGTYEDISDQVKAKEILERYTKELEFTNRELKKFAYVASHDLQEPLRKIQQFGDRLVAKHSMNLDEQGLDYLGRMQSSAHRMQILIQDLLAYSRVTVGALEIGSVDLTAVVAEVLEDLEVQIKEKTAQIIFSKLPVIEADPIQIKQLFLNLLSNALKFSDDEKPLIIQIEALEKERDSWQFKVIDNGIGFDEKYENRIFGVFQRLHTKQEYEGTGVGLALCKQVVEQHGGEIRAMSRLGEGSTFVFSLPSIQNV